MLKVEVARAGGLDDYFGGEDGGILSVVEYMPPDLFQREEGHLPWAIEQAELIDNFLANTIPAFVYDRLAMIMARHAIAEHLLEENDAQD